MDPFAIELRPKECLLKVTHYTFRSFIGERPKKDLRVFGRIICTGKDINNKEWMQATLFTYCNLEELIHEKYLIINSEDFKNNPDF